MAKNKPVKLLWQIYPSYLIIIIICVAIGSFYAFTSLKKSYYTQVEHALFEKAQLLSPFASALLEKKISFNAIDTLCIDAGKRANVRFTIVDSKGNVAGDSKKDPETMENHRERPEIRTAFAGDKGYRIRHSDTLKKEMMYVAIPLYSENKIAAVLRAAVALDFINNQLWKTNIGILITGLLIACIATIISFFFSLKITRPVITMNEGAKEFARGKLNTKLYIPDIEELADLAGTLNHMAEELDKRMSIQLRQSNELETVFLNMREGVLAIDLDKKIMRINQSALTMLSFKLTDIKGRPIHELIRDSDFYTFLDEALKTDKHASSDLKYGSNKEKIFNVHSSPLLDEHGDKMGYLFVIQDVTRIRHLESMRKDFVANVSHELKTPMTAIKGFVETIRESDDIEKDTLERFFAIIDKNVDRLINIINDLLDISWIEKNETSDLVQFREVNLQTIINPVIKICEKVAENKQVTIEYDNKSILTHVNKALMENALINLIDNAVKYSDENKTVRIKTNETPEYVSIAIQDNGIGISPYEQQRIFERFYRVDKDAAEKWGGQV